jgi:elongation factor Ts
MADITASMVKELRQRTGVGMMECKKALLASGGDVDEAIKALRKAGAAKAEKKSGRATGEGRVFTHVSDDGKTGALVELACETDFVARNEDFVALGKAIADHVASTEMESGSGEALLEQTIAGEDRNIGQMVTDTVHKLGENTRIVRFVRFSTDGSVAAYVHAGDKIAVLVELSGDAGTIGRDVAMHVAAAAPRFVGRDDVDSKVLDDEKEVLRAKTLAEGKPEAVVDKIVEGRIGKFFQEICLLEQPFVKNPEVTVEKMLAEAGGSTVVRFSRLAVGEEG